MIEEVNPANFIQIRNRSSGYLVNVFPGSEAIAHSLSGWITSCLDAMTVNTGYPKFYAANLDEARTHARQRYHVSCRVCQNC